MRVKLLKSLIEHQFLSERIMNWIFISDSYLSWKDCKTSTVLPCPTLIETNLSVEMGRGEGGACRESAKWTVP